MQGHVYHWRHGWIPLSHFAALQKAHGSHKGAAKYLNESNGHHGTMSGRHAPGSHEVTKADAFGDGRVDEVRLPSGHTVTVDRSTGRISTGLYNEDEHGRTAIDANPNLIEKRSVGTSIAHDDHHVLKGYKPGERTPEHKAALAVISRPALRREDINVAVQRGTMTNADAQRAIAKDAAERAAARAVIAKHVSGEPSKIGHSTRDQLGVLVRNTGPTEASVKGLPKGYLIVKDSGGLILKHNGKLIRASSTRDALIKFAHEHHAAGAGRS